MKTKAKTNVFIVGGGIAGLTLAILLGQSGLDVIIAERGEFKEPKGHNGRTAALMGTSIEVIKNCGIWSDLKNIVSPLQTMRIIDDSNPNIAPVQVDFKSQEIGIDCFGYNIPNDQLRYILSEKAQETDNVTLLSKVSLKDYQVQENFTAVILEDGSQINADLIVGADGKMSKVRSIANIKTQEHDYKQLAITCLMSHSQPHNNTSTEHHRTGGPFTMVPMPDGADGRHISSIVWVEKIKDGEGYMNLDKEAFEEALQIRTKGSLGEVKLESTPECWPLKGLVAKELVAPRVALIAEAAHALSPIGAQGLNLSLRDVRSLHDVLVSAAQVGSDIGAAGTLEQYERSRRIDVSTRFKGVNFYSEIVANNISALRGIRRLGLKSVNTIPPLKEFAMRQGLAS